MTQQVIPDTSTKRDQSAGLTCAACGGVNRSVARFCRHCGVLVPSLARDPFGQVLGLENVVANMRMLTASAGVLANNGTSRLRLHHVLLGRAGTGKSLLAQAFADACHQHGVARTAIPARMAASALLAERDLAGWLQRQMGSVVVIDDAHQLTQPASGGHGASHPLARLLGAMSSLSSEADPIVLLVGHAGPLLEYLDDSPEFRGRFPHVVTLPDLSPDTMTALGIRTLAGMGVKVAPEAHDRLFARMRHVHAQSVDGYINGWAVREDVEKMLVQIARPSNGRPALVLHVGDVRTPVHEARTREEILAELDALVGMQTVRAFIEELLDKAEEGRDRASRGAKAAAGLGGHIMLLGNPGTGKTTVARILARIFGASGLLPTERLVEADRGRLVADHVGGTAKLVHQACDAAQGGVLFIDEAYDLWRGQGDQFGQEAVTTLIKRLEDDRGSFVCVVAGYVAEMDAWLKANPGLPRRFPYRFTLPDYRDEELSEIFRRMVSDLGLILDPAASDAALVACRQLKARAGKRFGNAGEIRNLVEATERRAAVRVRKGGTMRGVILAEDIRGGENTDAQVEGALAALHAKLDTFVGLNAVKQTLRKLADVMSIERQIQQVGGGGGAPTMHWLFTGNPGTGKTVIARLMGEFFHAMGILPTKHVQEAKAEDLVGQYMGETKQKAMATIDKAMGGVLFIDEAHQLTPGRGPSNSYNRDALDVLLTRMENDRGRFVVIAAGYEHKIEEFLAADPGLPSRFTRRLHFPDYTADELIEVLRRSAADATPSLLLADGVADALKVLCDQAIAARGESYGNARFARKLLDATIENQRVRLVQLRTERPLETSDLVTLLPADVPDSPLSLV